MRDARANLGGEFFKPDPLDPTESEDGTGAVSGSIRYMAPEAALGERVDGRSDLYSAACMLFELVAGRPPFQGDSPIQVVHQHVKSPPPRVTDLVPGLPHQLDQVIEIGLAKDPGARFQTAEDFVAALEHLEELDHPRNKPKPET